MATTQELYLVSIPNNGKKPDAVFYSLANSLKSRSDIRLHKFETPALNVGTLDSLMAVSEDLSKLTSQVENVVRKVERQYNEVSGSNPDPLKINETAIDKYMRNFQWDYSKYRFQGKPISEIVSQVQGLAAKVDEELKKLNLANVEKEQAYTALLRKKSANLATADFEDVLTVADVKKIEILNTDTLLTMFVVLPVAQEKDFLANYHTIGSSIANYGGPEWGDVFAIGKNDGKFGPSLVNTRASLKGSPVAPGSAVQIKVEGEMALYTIVAIRGQYEAGTVVNGTVTEGKYIDYIEPLKTAFREKRIIVREFSYDSTRAGGLDAAIAKAKMEAQQNTAVLLRWCKAHFGELYSGLMHLRVMHGFVESVLRYGLPPDFLTLIFEPVGTNPGSAIRSFIHGVNKLCPQLLDELKASSVVVDPNKPVYVAPPTLTEKITGGILNAGAGGLFGGEEVVVELEGEENEEQMFTENNAENLPFVCFQYVVIGSPLFK